MANKDEWENQEDKNKDNLNDNVNESDDSFGLPDVSYEPLDDDNKTDDYGYEQDNDYGYQDQDQEYEPGSYQPKHTESKAPLIITLIVIVLAVAGGVGYFMYYKPMNEKNERYEALLAEADKYVKDKKWDSAVAKFKEAKKIKPDDAKLSTSLASAETELARFEEAAKQALEAEQAAAAAKEAEPEAEEPTQEPGTVETISSKTGRYYVVVASAIDGDLANDYAEKLAGKGDSPKVIEPYSKKPFYRVALADYEALMDAQTKAEELKGEYGDEVWVIRY